MNELILGVIPARSGSKGIPGKNLRLLAGHPLIEYTIKSAQGSGIIDRLVLTTDTDEIAAVGRSLGAEVPFLRPENLAQDDTPMLPVVVHAVSYFEANGWYPDIIVLLQPTAPMRTSRHIVEAVSLLKSTRADSVVSVVEVPRHFSPDYVMKIEAGKLVHFLPESEQISRRQDARPAYSRDGTVYVVRREVLMNKNSLYGSYVCPFILPPEESVNIDSFDDWLVAESRLKERISS